MIVFLSVERFLNILASFDYHTFFFAIVNVFVDYPFDATSIRVQLTTALTAYELVMRTCG
jgi:hypothetical protein